MPPPHALRWITTRARAAGLCLALIAGTMILLASVERHYPIQHWLFWRYAAYWLAAGIWSIGCASAGHRLVRALLGRPLPWLEQLAVSFAIGVFAFQLTLFVLGLLGLYHPITFFALPLVFLAVGGRGFAHGLRRAWLHLRSPRRASHLSPLTWFAILFGVLALVALYMPLMSPVNSSFDARWRHLYIAEQYVVAGGMRPFAEGWTLGASPHFTSLLYTWGFMFPGGQLFDRVVLCGHLEFVVFLWTSLFGVPALVRRAIPRANPMLVWAARFLFPGTFLYDSNLSVGADHVGALFAPALLLVCLRVWRSPTPRLGILLGALIAAAACAKETTALLLAPFPILLVASRFTIDLVRGPRARLWGSVAAGVTTVVSSSPHWLKNLVWYGDPLYPNLHAWFGAHPWSPTAAYAFEYGFKTMLWAPPHDLSGMQQALAALVQFSFRPYAWWSMHRDVPVFGSLFTLLLLALPFLRGARRIWFIVAAVHLSVFAWFWVHHEERHLQALVPWMAAAVAATLTLVWRHGRAVLRGCVALLVGAQLVWGADVYFIPTHSMTGGTAIKPTIDLLGQGFLLNFERRFAIQLEQVTIGSTLPADAGILLHETRDHLGFGRRVVADHTGDQYGIDYLQLGRPDRIYDRLRALGVTHLVWRDLESVGIAPLGADIAFYEFAYRHTAGKQRIGASNLAALLPGAPPKTAGERRVAVLGCGVDYPTGIYRLFELSTPRFGPNKGVFPRPAENLGEDTSWRERVIAVAIDPMCPHPEVPARLDRDFERVTRRGERWGRGHDLWIRR